MKDQALFDEKCVNKGGLCVVAFLDYNNFEQDEIDRYQYKYILISCLNIILK